MVGAGVLGDKEEAQAESFVVSCGFDMKETVESITTHLSAVLTPSEPGAGSFQ